MTRVPGTFKRFPDQWVIVRNPGYPAEPRLMTSVCHDGSPFLTVECTCGEQMHFHESQLAALPAGIEIGTHCHGCREELVFPPGHFEAAFARMREEGWIE